MAPRKQVDPPTLCWSCKNTSRFKCPWFNPDNPQPVDGWVAEPRVTYHGSETYLVIECPKFEPTPGRVLPQVPRCEAAVSTEDRRGVHRGVRHWVARITFKGKRYYLGYFKSMEQAIAARQAAEEAIARGEEPCRNNRR